MLEEFDPTSIEDPRLRTIVVGLMNLLEKQQTLIAEQAAEIQRLRDEISRLKGEQGKPKIRAKSKGMDLSSEKQRRESKPHQKSSKQAQITIDREEIAKVDQQRLPSDAVFKGYQSVVVQEISFRTENILFRKEKYYSPGQKQTYLAPLPAGYQGQFGPGVRAWVLALYYEGGMSEPADPGSLADGGDEDRSRVSSPIC